MMMTKTIILLGQADDDYGGKENPDSDDDDDLPSMQTSMMADKMMKITMTITLNHTDKDYSDYDYSDYEYTDVDDDITFSMSC